MTQDGAGRHLVYFSRRVLARYRAEPDKYRIREDGVEGSLTVTDSYAQELERLGEWASEPGEIRYGFRTLADGTVCLAVMRHDLGRLPEDHRHHWYSELLGSPTFPDSDPVFENLAGRWLMGDWEGPVGAIQRMSDLISLINACFPSQLPLFRTGENPLLQYPSTDNRDAYRRAVIELNKLLWENVDAGAVDWLGDKAHRSPTKVGDSGNRLGAVMQLESVMPREQSACLEPMVRVNKVRTEVHRIDIPAREEKSYWHVFDQDLSDVCEGLGALLTWLEGTLGVEARQVKKWRERMEFRANLVEIVGPPDPPDKHALVQDCVGRTVERIEFGRQKAHPDVHESEAVIFHFTDGSTLALMVGSNAQNLGAEYGIRPPEFHTDIIPWWVGPKPPGAR